MSRGRQPAANHCSGNDRSWQFGLGERVLSYDTWMLILTAAAALCLPFSAVSTVVDVLAYRRDSRAAQETGSTPPQRPRRAYFLSFLMSISLFELIFAGHELIPARHFETPTSYQEEVTETIGGVRWVVTMPGIASMASPGGEPKVIDFSITGIVVGADAVQLSEAYITSGITNEKKPLLVQTSKGTVPVDHIEPLTPNTEIQLVCHFNENDGTPMLQKNFIRIWGILNVTVKYGGVVFSHIFSGDQIRSVFGDIHPQPIVRH